MINLKNLLLEKTVRLSTMKDANFVPGQWVQIVGKKGMVKLDKKDVKYLAKWIRSNSGKHGMGWSFTENKIKEHTIKFSKEEMHKLHKDGKIEKADDEGKMHTYIYSEGKLNEGKKLRLPGGVEVTLDFKGVTFKARKGHPVFLDRDELLKFFRGSTKYLRYT